MPSQAARCRFLYSLNIVIPGALAAYCLGWPDAAAANLFGDTGSAGLLAKTGASPSLAYPMLGAWWAAIAMVSVLGLREPLKFRWVRWVVGSASPGLVWPHWGLGARALRRLCLPFNHYGLPDPIPTCSPVMLIQTLYKFVFIGTAVAPLALKGHWDAVQPAMPLAVYTAFLLPLFYCTPWGYLLGGAARGTAAEPAGIAMKAE